MPTHSKYRIPSMPQLDPAIDYIEGEILRFKSLKGESEHAFGESLNQLLRHHHAMHKLTGNLTQDEIDELHNDDTE